MQIVIDIPEKVYNEYMDLATGCIPTYKACDIAWVLRKATPLPKGHGRLGDLDVLEKLCIEHDIGNSAFDNSPMIEQGHYSDGDCIWKPLFDFAPTIIEADKESECV